MERIASDLKHGKNFSLGLDCIIEPDVVVGDNVTIGHKCIIKSGLRVGNNSVIKDRCLTSGAIWIGNNVEVALMSAVSRGTIIEDCVYFGPGVWSHHRIHLPFQRPHIPKEDYLTYIGYGTVIGTRCILLANLTIAPLTIIAGGSMVVESCLDPGIYFGSPARRMKDTPEMYKLDLPENAGAMYHTKEVYDHIKKYMPTTILPNLPS